MTVPSPDPSPSPPPSVARGWTLHRRVNGAIAAFLVLLLAMSAVMLLSLVSVQRRLDELTSTWTPSLLDSNAALAAMTDQETGLRGYALGQQDEFLEPYTMAQAPERQAEADLRSRLRGKPDMLAKLADFHTAVRAWQTTIAEPYIARVDLGDATVQQDVGSPAAVASFNRIRATSSDLTKAITAARTATVGARDTAITHLWIAVIGNAAVILVLGMAGFRTLRTSVLRPIRGLVSQVRQVAAGDLDLDISQRGPAEIGDLARDVNAMRAQLAGELARVDRARAQLARHGEELARSNADLEQFAYVASHDLSEPLRKVTNFCQLLERQYADELDDRARQYIGFMVDGAKRMQSLINDLLAFSRVGRTTDHFVPVDLDQMLARALGNLEAQVEVAGARVHAESLPTVPGDPTLLTALLQNLVGNAVKYRAPDRTPEVEITARRDGEVWELAVSDNGIGIEPQYAERIFVIFQRLHLRDQYGGTGIGLALCRKIVDFHGGRIWLAEQDGPGCRLVFTLPVRQRVVESLDEEDDGHQDRRQLASTGATVSPGSPPTTRM